MGLPHIKTINEYMDKCGYNFKTTYCFKAYYFYTAHKALDTMKEEDAIIYANYRIRLLFKYIVRKTVSPHGNKELVDIINNIFLSKRPSDNVIYAAIKNYILKHNINPNEIEKENYIYIECNIVKNLTKILPVGTYKNILDIGTERVSILHRLRKNFDADKVIGINIDDGFCHYDKQLKNYKDNEVSLILYDGKNIPKLGIKYDLIIITAVIHHIPEDILGCLIKQLYELTTEKGVIFIKDNNITNIADKSGIIIQHMIYEGSIIDAPHNPLFPRSFEEIKKLFAKYNFMVTSKEFIPNFSSAYYAVFSKTKFAAS